MLARWNAFPELDEVLNRFLRSSGSELGMGRSDGGRHETMTLADWRPTVDISETEDEFIIKAELPEVNRDDIRVDVHNGVLTIQGERKSESEETGEKFHRTERSYGTFSRSFTLPDNVDAENIRARHKDGMLYLQLTKTEETKPKQFEITID